MGDGDQTAQKTSTSMGIKTVSPAARMGIKVQTTHWKEDGDQTDHWAGIEDQTAPKSRMRNPRTAGKAWGLRGGDKDQTEPKCAKPERGPSARRRESPTGSVVFISIPRFGVQCTYDSFRIA